MKKGALKQYGLESKEYWACYAALGLFKGTGLDKIIYSKLNTIP